MNTKILRSFWKRKTVKFNMIQESHVASCKGKLIADTSYKGIKLSIIKCGDWYFLREPNQITKV